MHPNATRQNQPRTLPLREGQNREAVLGRGAPLNASRQRHQGRAHPIRKGHLPPPCGEGGPPKAVGGGRATHRACTQTPRDRTSPEPSPCGRVKTAKRFWGGVRRSMRAANATKVERTTSGKGTSLPLVGRGDRRR